MQTKTRRAIIIGILIFIVLCPVFWFCLPKTAIDKSGLTNMLFAVISIASMGFGLAFSNYDIDELKEKRDQIFNDKKMEGKLRDKLVLDINVTIKDMKPVYSFHGWLYVIIAILLSLGVIVNEVFDNIAVRVILRSVTLSILVVLSYSLLLLILDKRRLITLATSEYDKCLKQIKDVLDGDYTSLLPKK